MWKLTSESGAALAVRVDGVGIDAIIAQARINRCLRFRAACVPKVLFSKNLYEPAFDTRWPDNLPSASPRHGCLRGTLRRTCPRQSVEMVVRDGEPVATGQVLGVAPPVNAVVGEVGAHAAGAVRARHGQCGRADTSSHASARLWGGQVGDNP